MPTRGYCGCLNDAFLLLNFYKFPLLCLQLDFYKSFLFRWQSSLVVVDNYDTGNFHIFNDKKAQHYTVGAQIQIIPNKYEYGTLKSSVLEWSQPFENRLI